MLMFCGKKVGASEDGGRVDVRWKKEEQEQRVRPQLQLFL
jgi:hypothetical protein